MISIPLSEGFLYDLLSIAQVKHQRNSNNTVAYAEYKRLHIEIADRVGDRKHIEIKGSPEYLALLIVNEQIYDRNDEIKTRPVTAEDMVYTDGKVGERWRAKRALQSRWFPNEALTEQKFGYPTQ